jgi:AAA domain
VKLYESLYEQYPSHRDGVGIIAPYKAQRRLLKNMFRDRFGPSMGNVEISTIDGFQGREKDIVIFSCVRAPASGRGYQSPGSHHRTASLHFNCITLLWFSLLQFFVITIDLMTELAVLDIDDLVVYFFTAILLHVCLFMHLSVCLCVHRYRILEGMAAPQCSHHKSQVRCVDSGPCGDIGCRFRMETSY